MFQRAAIFLSLIWVAPQAPVGEFWLEPVKFRCTAGEEIRIDFQQGEGFTGDSQVKRRNEVQSFKRYSLSGQEDLVSKLKSGPGNRIMQKFPNEGTQLLAIQLRPVSVNRSSVKFREWLEDEELVDAINLRKLTNLSRDSIIEKRINMSKLLLQVDAKMDNTFERRTDLRLEIIPEKNPYSLMTGDYLKCKILFDGRPLPHALVKVWSRLNRTTFLQNIYSEKDGTIVFPLSTKGPWMVSTVKIVPPFNSGEAWESLWSSLVFGIE